MYQKIVVEGASNGRQALHGAGSCDHAVGQIGSARDGGTHIVIVVEVICKCLDVGDIRIAIPPEDLARPFGDYKMRLDTGQSMERFEDKMAKLYS